MLTFSHITKVFKTELLAQPFVALNDVSFHVPTGSMVGFLGANGAGKTTSLKIIMDFIRPDSGEVAFDGKLGKKKIDIFKRIGFLPERPYFYPNLTGAEFLSFMGSLSEMKNREIAAAVKKWGERFKIEYALKRPLRTYSKGMLQRIGFLATVLHDPDFIILDEPLSGLDPIGRKELKDVIVEVHREGRTVFFSSHIVPDIEEICDRVIFLKEGKLIYDGPVDKLLNAGNQGTYLVKVRASEEEGLRRFSGEIGAYPGGVFSLKISEDQKNRILTELIAGGVDVLGFELEKPSLEEIFYNIRSK